MSRLHRHHTASGAAFHDFIFLFYFASKVTNKMLSYRRETALQCAL